MIENDPSRATPPTHAPPTLTRGLLHWRTLWGGHLRDPRGPRLAVGAVAVLSTLIWIAGLLGADFSVPGGDTPAAYLLGAWTAVLFAWFVALLAASQAVARRRRADARMTARFVASIMLWVGLLDLVSVIGLLWPRPLTSDQILTLWAVSRTFMAVALTACAWHALARPTAARLPRWLAGLGLLGLLVDALVLAGIWQPRALMFDTLVGRPLDLPALVLFSFAGLVVLPQLHRVHPTPLSHVLIVASIPQVLCQLQAVFGNSGLFGADDVLAYWLKLLAYSSLLGALVLEMIARQRHERTTSLDFETAQRELTKQTEELQRVDRERVVEESKRRRAERSLRMLEKAVETMSIGVTICDPRGSILYINPAGAELHGYAVEAVVGHDIALFSVGDDPFIVPQTALSREQPWARETLHITRDGREFPVRLVSDAVRDADGQVLAVVTSCEDITERRQVDKMKHDFISTVSHELRTPLTSIIASLGLLAHSALRDDPKHVEDLVSAAHRNSNRLLQLINDLLDLQKLTAGKLMLDLQPVDVGAVLEESVAGIQAFADEVDIPLRLHGVPAGLMALGDRRRLNQVLLNLLSNAIKFSPTGTPVEVNARRGDHRRVVLSVADQGPGIPPEFRGRLFERFTQIDSSATRRAGGSGLGLTIVKELVEAMEGSVSFETEIGQGTTFFVELPAAK